MSQKCQQRSWYSEAESPRIPFCFSTTQLHRKEGRSEGESLRRCRISADASRPPVALRAALAGRSFSHLQMRSG
jgi:hypothetical protein